MSADVAGGRRGAERAPGSLGFVAAALAATAAGVGVASWGASQILVKPTSRAMWRMHRPLRVVDVDKTGGRIMLAGPDAAIPGTWGLRWADGYAQVDAAPQTHTDTHTPTAFRPFRMIEGTPPARGTTVHWDPLAWPDRAEMIGLPVQLVPVPGPVCELPAWLYPTGDGEDWAIFVHGRKSRRAQAFRALRTVHAAGWSCMTISYRNDDWLPRAGLYGLGATEWQDLEAAVALARQRGAKRIILVGYSLGGAIVSSFLRHSEHAEAVEGLILDSPVLDWQFVLRRLARSVGLPEFLASTAMAATTLRTGIDFGDLDQLAHAAEFTQPTLLIHGDADEQVPVELSRMFAEVRGVAVRYLEVPGAGHVVSWNHDPAAYDAALAGFLEQFAPQRQRRRLPMVHLGHRAPRSRGPRRHPRTPPVATA